MQYDFLAVKLVVDKHLHVVLFLGYVDRYVHTATFYFDHYRLGVVLILKKERELLRDGGQLDGHERELDFCA